MTYEETKAETSSEVSGTIYEQEFKYHHSASTTKRTGKWVNY